MAPTQSPSKNCRRSATAKCRRKNSVVKCELLPKTCHCSNRGRDWLAGPGPILISCTIMPIRLFRVKEGWVCRRSCRIMSRSGRRLSITALFWEKQRTLSIKQHLIAMNRYRLTVLIRIKERVGHWGVSRKYRVKRDQDHLWSTIFFQIQVYHKCHLLFNAKHTSVMLISVRLTGF